MKRIIAALFAAALFATSALAQNWPPVPLGQGSGGSGGGGGGGGTGTVTSVATSCGVSGGPITTSGTVSGAVVPNAPAAGSAYTFLASDCGKLVILSDGTPRAPSLPTASFVANNFINIVNTGAGAETITPTTGTICGSATVVLQQNQGVGIAFDGTNWQCGGGPYVRGPPSATSGHIATFSGATGQLLQDGGAPGGTGTVTSASFAGGLISVATPTTTPAFTVAGTSGGISYFSSATTWASSAALAAGSLVEGGGAGAAPSTFTLGGDCTFTAPNITCTSINGKALTLGGPLTTTGAGTTTLAFGAAGFTYTFPSASVTLGTASGPGSSVSGNLVSFNGTGGQTLQDSGILASSVIHHAPNIQTFSQLAKVGSAAVAAVGSGYVTNDTITVSTTGGTCSTAPVLTVTASAGAITALAVTTAGSCTVLPTSNPSTQGSTSGVGTGGTFVITWAAITQTYTPTAGMVICDVYAYGGGGGGGGGALQVASTAVSGAGGGGGGSLNVGRFTAAVIGASQTMTVGISGTGGLAATANTTAGGNGVSAVGNSSFGAPGPIILAGIRGGGGAGGQLAAAAGGGGGAGLSGQGGNATSATNGTAGAPGGGSGASATTTYSGSAGGIGANGALGGVGFLAYNGGAGGGAGGGVSAANAATAGGNGGALFGTGANQSGATGGAAGSSGNPGITGAGTALFAAGTGAGGGGSGISGTAGNGGLGGIASGGGGGGSMTNGGVPGAGGNGGPGLIIVVEFF
jgi:hypothetical protein